MVCFDQQADSFSFSGFFPKNEKKRWELEGSFSTRPQEEGKEEE